MNSNKPEISAKQSAKLSKKLSVKLSIKSSEKLSDGAKASVETVAVALPAFWSVIQLFTWYKPPLNTIVLAVMLGVMLPRAMKKVRPDELLAAAAAFAAGTAAAVCCGMLIENNDALRIPGALLFAAGTAVPVWLRRFGNVWKNAGTVFAVPFMAILVHPVPMDLSIGYFGWMLVAAAIALFWTLAAKLLKGSSGIPNAVDSELPAAMPKPAAPPSSGSPAAKKRELLSSTKMAVQLFAAVAAAFACAQFIDAGHLVWPVLTVLIVHSGNIGRGDLLWKGAQRTAGALIGVAIASLLAVNFPPGNSAEIAAIFAILVLAAFVREFGYIFWAVCIPAALVFLYSFFGQTGAELTAHLARRLLGITIGSIAGIACGFIILPVRMTDIVRLRLSALLSIAGDFVISAARGKPDKTLLDKLAAAKNDLLHFNGAAIAAKFCGIGCARRLYGAIAGACGLAQNLINGNYPPEPSELAALAKEIGAARRSLSAGTVGPGSGENKSGESRSAENAAGVLSAADGSCNTCAACDTCVSSIIAADLKPKK
ncbi:MAG: FUSC family protein [Treponema sp.]|nr:FUSC family protein [Treponema sp.]